MRKQQKDVEIPKWVNSPHRKHVKEVNQRKDRNFKILVGLAVLGALRIFYDIGFHVIPWTLSWFNF